MSGGGGMEWGRAKTILIWTFFLLNVLLAYQLWVDQWDVFGSAFGRNEEIAEVEHILQERGIALRQEIPLGVPKVKEIYVKYERRAEEDGAKRLSPPIPADRIGRASTRDMLKDQIPHFERYEQDPALSGPDRLVWDQMADGLPMFEINLSVAVEDGRMILFEQDYVEIQPSPEAKEQPGLAAYRVVRLLAERFLQRGDGIADIRLGYHGQMYESDTQVLAPKWRIVLDNGDIYYVHAVNGEVERP
jgi:regulatory protein YycI of two-component signal transduction system YycFG